VGSISARGTGVPYKKGFSARITYRWFPADTPVSSTIKIEKILIILIIGSSEGGFRSRDVRKRAEKKVKYE
jgi:hypothetical protein